LLAKPIVPISKEEREASLTLQRIFALRSQLLAISIN